MCVCVCVCIKWDSWHKKKQNSAIYRDEGRPRDWHTEESQEEKQALYTIASMWNLEKWYRLIYWQK